MKSTIGGQINDSEKSNFLALQSSLIHTIDIAKKSVVSITISKNIKMYIDDPTQLNGPGSIHNQTTTLWWWSGIIVSKKWYIITNKHVVQDTEAKYSVTLYDWTNYHVDKIWFDDILDIAILKIIDTKQQSPTNLVEASFLDIDQQVYIGQFSLIIWNTFSTYPHTVTMGIIWNKNKKITINWDNLYVWLYQTDTQAHPGNSWGPLLDIEWHVIGIITAIVEWNGMSFALPTNQEFIESTLHSIETFWKISRPIMGIQYTEWVQTTDNGIYITDILTDLPAWEAWLKIWDNILNINKQPINNQNTFLYLLYTHIPGETISLDIIRDNRHITLPVYLGSK